MLLWLLALEVSPAVLDGVVLVQVETWLEFQDRAGHHIKAEQGWIIRVVPFKCECSTVNGQRPD